MAHSPNPAIPAHKIGRPLWLGLFVGMIFLLLGLVLLLGQQLHAMFAAMSGEPVELELMVEGYYRATSETTFIIAMILLISGVSILIPTVSDFAAWGGGTIKLKGSQLPVEVGGGAFLFFALCGILGLFSYTYEPWEQEPVFTRTIKLGIDARDVGLLRQEVKDLSELQKVYDNVLLMHEKREIGLLRVAIECEDAGIHWVNWRDPTGASNRIVGRLDKENRPSSRLPLTTSGKRYEIKGNFGGPLEKMFDADLTTHDGYLTLTFTPGDREPFSLSKFCRSRIEETRNNSISTNETQPVAQVIGDDVSDEIKEQVRSVNIEAYAESQSPVDQ